MGHSAGALRTEPPLPSQAPAAAATRCPSEPADDLSPTPTDAVVSNGQTLTMGDINLMKGLRVIDEIHGAVLTAFYETHFPGGTMPLIDWLLDTGQKWKKDLSKDQRETVEARTEFRFMDVTLQHKILTLWCRFRPSHDPCWKNDTTSQEYWLQMIKNQRNKLAHEMKNLRKTLMEEGERNRLFDELRHTSLNALDKLREYKAAQNLPVSDLEKLKDKLVTDLNTLKRQDIVVDVELTEERLKNNGILETKANTELTDVQPFPEILGVETFKLHQIYEPLDLYIEERSLSPEDTQKVPLTIDKLLSTAESGGHKPNVICLDGPSGAGKSTLLAYVLSHYLDAGKAIDELDTFDLVLHFQCKLANCGTTLKDLIKSSFPKTSSNISDDLLVRAARNLKILVLADGFDEVSEQATALLEDLYRESHHGNLRVLLTTRTGSMYDAVALMAGTRYLRVTISTLPKVKAEIMAKKFYLVLRSRLATQPAEDQVLEAVSNAAKLLVRTPRIIILLTYLACVKPNQITSLLTLAELLDALDEIYVHILHQRLSSKGLSSSLIKEEVSSFSEGLNALALECLLSHEADLYQSHLRRLADTCSYPTDMLDTFLACTRRRTATGDQTTFSFPHLSQLEYRAALGIRDRLVKIQEKPQCWPGSARVLHRILQTDARAVAGLRRSLGMMQASEGMSRYWNLLLTLIGVLKVSNLLLRHAHELAHLVLDLRSNDEDAVLEAIGQSGLDPTFSAAITSRWSRHEWLITDHLRVLKAVQHFPNGINLVLKTCCNEVPGVAEAIQILRGKTLQVSLSLLDCMEDKCSQGSCTWPLTHLTAPGASCSVWRLQGPVDAATHLPASLRILHLTVGSPEGMATLKKQLNHLPYLTSLGVRVSTRAGDMRAGPPTRRSVDLLWLYHVADEDREWVTGLLASFHAQRTYRFLWFGENQLSPKGYAELVDRLWELGVRIEGVSIHSPVLLESWQREYPRLSKLTRQRLGSHLRMCRVQSRHS